MPYWAELLKPLEVRIKEALNKTPKCRPGTRDGENFYRLPGAYRGVSEPTGDYVASTEAIQWSRWKEEIIYLIEPVIQKQRNIYATHPS